MISLSDLDLDHISNSELGQLLIKAKNAYYTTDKPIMDDATYDTLEDLLKKRAPYHRLFSKVGHDNFDTGWPKAKHAFILGSQNKASSFEDLVHYFELKKIPKNTDFITQPKCDGISLEIQYKKGKLEQAITRGDGRVGDLVTQNVVKMQNVVLQTKKPFTGSIRCEIIVTYVDFKKLNAIVSKKNSPLLQGEIPEGRGVSYSNPRNAASGLTQRLDGQYAHFCTLLAVDIWPSPKTEMDGIRKMRDLGFTTVDTWLCQNFEHIQNIYQQFLNKKRDNYPYEIDGLVVKVNDQKLQDSLGSKNLRPKGQVAYKFPADSNQSIIKSIDWQTGPLGHVTPVAQIQPVKISGAVIEFISLANYQLVKQKNINVADIVEISRRGDVIPYIEKVITKVKKGHVSIPTTCNSCGNKLIKHDKFLDCPNHSHCPAQTLGRLNLFTKKLDILGLSDKTIKRLVNAKKVKLPGDFFKLTVEDIAPLDRLGDKSAKNIVSQIQSKKELTLAEALNAISIPNFSKKRIQQLISAGFDTPQKILNLTKADLLALPGFKITLAQKIIAGIKQRQAEIKSVLDQIKIKKQPTTNQLQNKKFAITGSLSQPRKDIEQKIINAGGQVVSSVTKNTDYLITNDKKSTSSKFKNAQKFATKIITSNQLNKLLI